MDENKKVCIQADYSLSSRALLTTYDSRFTPASALLLIINTFTFHSRKNSVTSQRHEKD